MRQRRHFKHSESLKDRLAAFAADAEAKAALLPPGAERDEQLKKIRQADLATRMDDLSGPGPARQSI